MLVTRRKLRDGDKNLEVQKPFELGAEFVPYAPIDHRTDIDDFKAQGKVIEQREPSFLATAVRAVLTL